MREDSLNAADVLRRAFRGLEVSDDFTEAVVVLDDASRLDFCHRVGRRTVQASGGGDATVATQTLACIVLFRLNARHLDVQFSDGSRWETLFGQ